MNREFVRRVSFVVGVLLLLIVVWFARHVVLLAFAALLLALVFVSLSNWASRFLRLPYKLALGLVIAVLLGLIVLGATLLAPGLSDLFADLAEALPKQAEAVHQQVKSSTWYQNIQRVIPEPEKLFRPSEGALSKASRVFSITADALSGIILVLFTGLFLSVDPERYKKAILQLVPPARRDRAREVTDKVICTLKYWLLGQFIAMLVVGTVVGIALSMVGISLAPALGILAGVLEFVPFVGPVIASIPALLLAASGGMNQVLIVGAIFLGVQLAEGYILTPMVQHRTVDLPPVITLLALVVMGTAFGFIGLFVATPFAAMVMVLVQELYIKDVLGEKPVLL